METLSVLIADSTEEFRSSLSSALQGTYHTRCSADGQDALRQMKENPPDILVLDLMLPGLDGISLLHDAVEAGICPMVLATSRFINDYIISSAESLGVSYLVLKPCDIRGTVNRIHDLSQRIHRPPETGPDARCYVSNMLTTLGISTKLKGYSYLREAILLIAKDPMQSITKELYPSVAKICGTTSMHVERSIRTAITAAWNDRDERIWCQYFQATANGLLHHPSNAVFITQLANRVILEQLSIPMP